MESAKAIKLSLTKVLEEELQNVITEADHKHVIDKLLRQDSNDLLSANLLEDILALRSLVGSCGFSYVSKSSCMKS